MSDKAQDSKTDRDSGAMAGSGAGDAAHTSEIPRISDGAKDAKPVTDKGRPRPAASKSGTAKGSSNSAKTSNPTKSPNATKKPAAPGDSSTGRPLSASDYARATARSPSTTAVIPAVKTERQGSSVPKTVAPNKNRQQPAQKTSPMPMTESPGTDARGGRAATLRMSYIEPWSVTRMAFAISVAMMIVGVVAVAIFWVVLDVTGVWEQIDGSVTTVLSDDSSSFRITDYLGFGRLVGLSLVVSALNVIIMTILATIAAHLYNLAAQLLGGFEVTYTSQD